MAWTTPATWTVGEVPTAAKMNTQVRDNLNALGQHAHTGADGDGATLGAYFDVFGDGSDGALDVASGTTTITADKQYTDVTVAVGATLVINSGVTVRCTGTFTNNGTVHCNGAAGGDASAGAAGQGGYEPGRGGTGGAGGAGSLGSPGSPTTIDRPGMGGASFNAGRTGGNPGWPGIGRSAGTGGGGGVGAGTGRGGGGGQGGGWYRVCAPVIAGSGDFEAKGGRGGNGYSAGGGNDGEAGSGGGGGYIETLSVAAPDNNLTFAVTGGAEGTGTGAYVGLADGGEDGVAIHVVLTSASG